MKRIYVDGKSTGFVVAKDLAAIMAELPPEPANVIPSNCVARTSLCDGVQQHLLRSLFRLRMTCNNAWGWLVRLVDLTFDHNDWDSQDRWLHCISLAAAHQRNRSDAYPNRRPNEVTWTPAPWVGRRLQADVGDCRVFDRRFGARSGAGPSPAPLLSPPQKLLVERRILRRQRLLGATCGPHAGGHRGLAGFRGLLCGG